MALSDNLAGLLVDLDGVVYRGEEALPGAADFFTYLRRRDLRFCLITNNSTQTPERFVAKLAGLGITVDPGQVVTSAEATGAFLAQRARPGSRVYVIGERGLREAVRKAGFGTAARRPDYVVVGLDQHLTYAKLRRAALAILRGAQFIASNADASLPTEDGLAPGAGAIVAALQVATGVSPVVIGKPQPTMLELALRLMGLSAAETAIVGDRLETDVQAGRALEMRTILLLTGVTTRAELEAATARPDYVFDDLRQLQLAIDSDRGCRG